jgi:glycosyltransferase involved in cell wall biosynthesis
MATIAFSIIGHNNGHQLARCLDSIRWADEIVYVDCESRDDSLAVARRYTQRVFERPNNRNLNVNKSYGFEQVTADWIFYLDPDEVIPPALAAEIRAVAARNPRENAFALPRRNHYFGRWLRHGGQYPDTQVRMFRRGRAHFACRHVHEKLEVEGATGRLREAMWHYPCETVQEQIGKMDFYSTFNAELMAREGVRPTFGLGVSYCLVKPLDRFLRRAFVKRGVQDGWAGLIVIAISSIDFVYRFFKLWDLTVGAAARERPAAAENPAEPVSHSAAAGSRPSSQVAP